MGTELREGLRALADQAATPGWEGDRLWSDGVRRERRRTTGRVLAAAAALALVAGAAWQLVPRSRAVRPADTPFSELHLPRTVYPPDPWSQGNAELGPPGPLAVIAAADRERADGLRSIGYTSWFGVSAVDGSARFLDLETDLDEEEGPVVGVVALSPDGRAIGYTRFAHPTSANGRTRLIGWSVYDTVTGRVLDLPARRAFHLGARPILGDVDLGFTGDSRYLVTHGSGRGTRPDQQLVAWDVETGEPHVVEHVTARWSPQLGTAESGVMWVRGRTVRLVDPATGASRERTEPRSIVTPGSGPGGQGFAYVGYEGTDAGKAPWGLYVASGSEPARPVDLDFDAFVIDGWTDAEHVVVSDFREHRAVVDVTTGQSRPVVVGTRGVMWPSFASDLWANPLVDGVKPPDVMPAPVRAWLTAGAVAVGLFALGVVAWRRGRRV